MLTVVEKVIFLQNIDIFSEVPTEQLAYLAAIAEEANFLKNDVLFREGDSADALFLVLQGRIRLHRGEEEIAVAGEKEAFGAWALFDDESRLVTATALEDSNLLLVDREDFVDLLADHVQITQGILKNMVGRLRGLVGRIAPGAGSSS